MRSALMKALNPAPDIRQYVWAPLVVLLVGLTATSVVAWQMWRMAEADDVDRFSNYLAETKQNLNVQLEAYADLLRDGAALFTATDTPDRGGFRAYVEQIGLRKPLASSTQQLQPPPTEYPALKGIGWIRRDTKLKAENTHPGRTAVCSRGRTAPPLRDRVSGAGGVAQPSDRRSHDLHQAREPGGDGGSARQRQCDSVGSYKHDPEFLGQDQDWSSCIPTGVPWRPNARYGRRAAPQTRRADRGFAANR